MARIPLVPDPSLAFAASALLQLALSCSRVACGSCPAMVGPENTARWCRKGDEGHLEEGEREGEKEGEKEGGREVG